MCGRERRDVALLLRKGTHEMQNERNYAMTMISMMRTLLFAVLIATVGLTETFAAADAVSQTGGVPSLSDRVAALEQIAGTLRSQVSALQEQVTTLQGANSALQSALDAEIANRKLGDSTLQTSLDN